MKKKAEEPEMISEDKLNSAIDYVLNLPVNSLARERVAKRKAEREEEVKGADDDRELSI